MTTQTQAFTYSKVFTKIKPSVIALTTELVKAGIFKKDISMQDKAIMMGLWVKKASEIYGMEAPKFYLIGGKDGKDGYRATGGGCYIPSHHEIHIFKKASLTTLLHEFRHAMQFQQNVKKFRNDHEEDARAWSVSLYRLSAPNSYKRAVEKGILHFK
jgi:hypothetical protein